MTDMTEARLIELIEAYGGDPEAWPEGERAAALALLSKSEAAQAALSEARALDGLLGAGGGTVRADGPLKARIAAIPEPKRVGLLAGLWPFGGIWQPAAGLAAAAVVGFILGTGAPAAPDSGADQAQDETVFAVIAAAGGDIEESLQ